MVCLLVNARLLILLEIPEIRARPSAIARFQGGSFHLVREWLTKVGCKGRWTIFHGSDQLPIGQSLASHEVRNLFSSLTSSSIHDTLKAQACNTYPTATPKNNLLMDTSHIPTLLANCSSSPSPQTSSATLRRSGRKTTSNLCARISADDE